MIYEFKVTLRDVGIPVWRTIQIDGSATFYDLHRVLQVVFDWDNYHLHSFFVNKTNGERVGNVEINPDREDEPDNFLDDFDSFNEKEQFLSDWFKLTKDNVLYMYDFGDDWSHEIIFNKKLKPEKDVNYPRCTDAKNIAPEEDSRGEVLMGGGDLEYKYSSDSIEEINEELRFQLPDLINTALEEQTDEWEEVLTETKVFHKLKPWKKMDDEHIFAVIDPVTGERLFCSVLGAAGETFGLAVYIGEQGYLSLLDILNEKEMELEAVINQRSLLLSFEDREDLEEEDYAFIKTYDVSFRGRKSWPHFRSLKPGYYPWLMNDEEARLMLIALKQAIDIYKGIATGTDLPDLLFEGKVLTSMPQQVNDEIIFEHQVLDLTNYPEEKQVVPLAISELELQRIKKLKASKQVTIEFSVGHIMMPVQNDPNERPLLPLLILAADHKQGLVMHQNLIKEPFSAVVMQTEFFKMIQTLNFIPGKIMMNHKNAELLEPLIDELALNVEVEEILPVVQGVLEELYNRM